MLIANPIYDVVFKYLMEDIEIARDLLSVIIGRNIVELTLKPQETSTESESAGRILKIYRLDFKAIIKDKSGKTEKVLIELQKSKKTTDVMRFRNYLAANYGKEDEIINEQGAQEIKPLPIITIYFLGYKLDNVTVPVLKVQNCYYDVIRNERVEDIGDESFIHLLNHESYTIQIPYLKNEMKTQLENVLMVFSQEFVTENKQQLDITEQSDDPLAQKIIRRLSRAAGDKALRTKMDLEDEWDRIYKRELQGLADKVAERDEVILQKDKELSAKDKLIEELKKQLKDKK